MRIRLHRILGNNKPTAWARSYLLLLLALFLLGTLEHLVDSEGMGFLPLLLLTTPWSWLLIPTWDLSIWGNGPLGADLAVFVTCNLLAGSANSYLLYLLIRWRKSKTAEQQKLK